MTRFVPAADSGAADHDDLYADTDRDGSPDARVRWDRTRDARFATAYRTDDYGARPDPDAVTCARAPRRLVGGDRTSVGQTVVLQVPGRCLDGAAAVRVIGVTTVALVGASPRQADWAPAARRSSGPVARRQGD